MNGWVTENREVGNALESQAQMMIGMLSAQTVKSKRINYQVMGTKLEFRWVWEDSEKLP